METGTEKIYQTELEKQVEIRILQREIVAIENKRKKFLSWQAFVTVVLIGATIGGFISTTNYELTKSESYKIAEYLRTNKHPLHIVYKYYRSNDMTDTYYEDKYVQNINKGIDSTKKIFGQKNIDSLNESFLSKIGERSEIVVDSVNAKIAKDIEGIKADANKYKGMHIIKGSAIGVLVSFSTYFLYILIFVFLWKLKINKIKLELNAIGAKELKQNLSNETGEDFFTQLVKINFKYLDQYYLQTQEQADKSFWISAIVSIVGFLTIIAGIILMYNSVKPDTGYVATSAGVLSEFISAIFFYLYNRTILKMSQYHQKLVLTQNISIALKTADHLKDTKEKVLENLIDRLTVDINKYLTNSTE